MIGVFVAIGVTAALLVRAAPAFLKQLGEFAKPAARAIVPLAESSAKSIPEPKEYHQVGRVFTMSGYRIDVPEAFDLDVLRQPANVPRGGRFTGVRFRGELGDTAQLHVIVVDYGDELSDTEGSALEARLQAAFERLFARLTRNAFMSHLTRGDMKFADVNGLSCLQTGFSGDFRDEGKKWRVHRSGTALVTVEPRRDVYVFSLWEGSTDRKVREVLTASLLTLRKADQTAKKVGNEPSSADQ